MHHEKKIIMYHVLLLVYHLKRPKSVSAKASARCSPGFLLRDPGSSSFSLRNYVGDPGWERLSFLVEGLNMLEAEMETGYVIAQIYIHKNQYVISLYIVID